MQLMSIQSRPARITMIIQRILGLLFLYSSVSPVGGFTAHVKHHGTTVRPFDHQYLTTRPSISNHRILHDRQSKRSIFPLSLVPPSFTSSLIGSTDTWGNIATLTGNAALSQQLGTKTKIGKLLGGPVTAMAITFLLASIGVLSPGGTAASKSLQILSLQLATPLVLLGADLRDCISRCGPLLLSFAVASVATIVACVIGWSVSGNLLMKALGKNDGLIIAAALMAKNIGGASRVLEFAIVVLCCCCGGGGSGSVGPKRFIPLLTLIFCIDTSKST